MLTKGAKLLFVCLIAGCSAASFVIYPIVISSSDSDCDYRELRAVPGNCSLYNQCSSGREYVMGCAPTLYFSVHDQTCSHTKIEDCLAEIGEHQTTTKASTTEATTETTTPTVTTLPVETTTTSLADKCSTDKDNCVSGPCQEEFATWSAMECGCAYYYECSFGNTCLNKCGLGMAFDEELGYCNFYLSVDSCHTEKNG